MSLVGPRPERPTFVEQFAADLGYYAARHRVPVGPDGPGPDQRTSGRRHVDRRPRTLRQLLHRGLVAVAGRPNSLPDRRGSRSPCTSRNDELSVVVHIARRNDPVSQEKKGGLTTPFLGHHCRSARARNVLDPHRNLSAETIPNVFGSSTTTSPGEHCAGATQELPRPPSAQESGARAHRPPKRPRTRRPRGGAPRRALGYRRGGGRAPAARRRPGRRGRPGLRAPVGARTSGRRRR